MRNHDGLPMKIVLCFRQEGGTAARDDPEQTHWTGNENGIAVPRFSALKTGARMPCRWKFRRSWAASMPCWHSGMASRSLC